MTKVKNRSQDIHTSRTRTKSSRLSTHKKRDRQIFNVTKKSILFIIILSMLIVILVLLLSSFENPERLVKQKLTNITSDYYENYYYPNLIGSASSQDSLEDIMSHYTEVGFATISLRQLLLFDNERYKETATFLKKYCDENQTTARIYPEAPFGKTNYRIDYHYSCAF